MTAKFKLSYPAGLAGFLLAVSVMATAQNQTPNDPARATALGQRSAAGPSYVVLQKDEKESLVRISADGKRKSVIASGIVGGVGLAKDSAGNYIVLAKDGLLRVTPSGAVTTIARVPAGSDWNSVAIDPKGNFILSDGGPPAVWRVSADGTDVVKVAAYNDVTSLGGRAAAVAVENSGNYLLLVEGTDSARRPTPWLFRITPDGVISEIPIKGARPIKVMAMAPSSDSFAVVAWENPTADAAVFTLTSDGKMTKAFDLPGKGYPEGLAVDSETGEIVVTLPYLGTVLRVPRAAASPYDDSVLRIQGLLLPCAVILEPAK